MRVNTPRSYALMDQALEIRAGIRDYLACQSPSTLWMGRDLTRDLTWHPLFHAGRELFLFLIEQSERAMDEA